MDRPSSTESRRHGRSPARSDARSGSTSRPPLTRSSTATKTSSPLTASTTHSSADHGHAPNPRPLHMHAASRRGMSGSMHPGTPATTPAGTPIGTPPSRKSSGWEHVSAVGNLHASPLATRGRPPGSPFLARLACMHRLPRGNARMDGQARMSSPLTIRPNADQAPTAAVEGDMWPRSPSDDSSDETPPSAPTLKK